MGPCDYSSSYSRGRNSRVIYSVAFGHRTGKLCVSVLVFVRVCAPVGISMSMSTEIKTTEIAHRDNAATDCSQLHHRVFRPVRERQCELSEMRWTGDRLESRRVYKC